MNTIFLLTLALLPADTASSTPLYAAETVADVGDARAGIPLTHTFQITNRGSIPLTITDVAAVGCACIQPRINVQLLPPGRSAEVRVEVNTLAQPAGPNSWKVAVRYRAEAKGTGPIEGEQLLELKAHIVREVSVEPATLSLIVAGPLQHGITVTDRRAKPLTVTHVRCSSPHIAAEVLPPTRDENGRRVQHITLKIADTCPLGRLADVVCLDTDDPDYKEFRIPVQVTKRSAASVTVVPEQAVLRLATGQTSASMLLRLRDGQDRRVTVERIEADDPAIRTKWAPGPGEMATLRVGVELGQAMRAGKGTIKVQLRDPEAQIIEIPVSWRGADD
jgi:Protein of unknown function (DUF1573)